MYLLLDFSQIVISDAIAYNSRTKESIDLDLLRHIVLKNIQFYKTKFKVSNDNMYICFDGKMYWRKTLFPYYKQNRKKAHDESVTFNWNEFFVHFNAIKDELKNELPYKTMEVSKCEADDLIAVLSQILCSSREEIIIVSSDKDFIQIQQNLCDRVKQWSPYHKKFITSDLNNYNLFEHIVRGDAGDGIPNILSDDDVFVTSKRSKPIRLDMIKRWEKEGNITEPEVFCSSPEMLDNFNRNQQLIDLRMIPEDQKSEIAQAFNSCSAKKVDVFGYLVKHKLRKIMESGGL